MNNSDSPRWQNRIVRYEADVDPEQLLANPWNHRVHPHRQSKALRAILGEVGYVDAVLVNTVTDHVIDGHLRVADAISESQPVPVLYVELTEDEERKVLATFDTITGLAAVDTIAAADLAANITFADPILTEVVAELFTTPDTGPGGGQPDPKPENPLVWGFVGWGKNKRIDSTETEVMLLDAAYETYLAANDGDAAGFVRWLVEAER